jgi:hypothetical protein
MATFSEMLKRFQSFDPIAATGDAMLENKEQIIGINQDELYERGVGKDGQKLPPYSPQYAKKKRNPDIVDIYQTGRLYSRMNLRVEGNEYEINSSVPYSVYVQEKRPTIYGLNELGKKETWVIIQPEFVYYLKQVTQTT